MVEKMIEVTKTMEEWKDRRRSRIQTYLNATIEAVCEIRRGMIRELEYVFVLESFSVYIRVFIHGYA